MNCNEISTKCFVWNLILMTQNLKEEKKTKNIYVPEKHLFASSMTWLNTNLFPMTSLSFFRASSAISLVANCTKASPEFLPFLSRTIVTPSSTISNPDLRILKHSNEAYGFYQCNDIQMSHF